MEKKPEMIAVCGLDCGPCDMREASDDPKLAKEIVEWFERERNEGLKIEDIHCRGCKGDREEHWAPDCWILQCCVDEKGLEFCSDCGDFPCDRLEKWATGSERYGIALDRLQSLRRNS